MALQGLQATGRHCLSNQVNDEDQAGFEHQVLSPQVNLKQNKRASYGSELLSRQWSADGSSFESSVRRYPHRTPG
jgi:hypothetical protein